MTTTTAALTFISGLYDGTPYERTTKSDLFESLKRARHAAKCTLATPDPLTQLAEAFVDYCTGAALDADGDLILYAQDDGTPHPLVQMALRLAETARTHGKG